MTIPFEEMFEGSDRYKNRNRENVVVTRPILMQIMAPDGNWRAVFRHPRDGFIFKDLVCWGLYRTPSGNQVVVGMVAEDRKIQPITDIGIPFDDYVDPKTDWIDWIHTRNEKVDDPLL